MLVLEWKEIAFIGKVNSRCFCWFPVAILVHHNGAPIWRLHTNLYKGAWNVSANNSETMGHKDLRLRQIVYILVFYNISFSWLLPLNGFQFNLLLRDSENDLLLFEVTKEVKLSMFQYKIIHNILCTKSLLFKIKKEDSPRCPFCPADHTLIYLFTECTQATLFWKEFLDWVSRMENSKLSLSIKLEIMFGIINNDSK